MWVDWDDGHAGGYPHDCPTTELRECVCGREFPVDTRYAQLWTVCWDCMSAGEKLT